MKKPPFLESSLFAGLSALLVIAAVCVAVTIWKGVEQVPEDSEAIFRTNAVLDRKVKGLEKPQPPRSDYVGSAACAQCHPEIAESYHSQPMAHSLSEASTAASIEDYVDRNTFAADAHHSYSVEKTPEGVFHHERLTDDKGQELYDQSVPIAYAMGSGHQGRSYLIDRGGLFFMSPITWYSHAGRWDLSPQYKLPVHRRFERRIIAECVDCHVGRANSVRGSDNRFATPPFLEAAIGCERCHGPGGAHASLHRQGSVNFDRDPIVNPSKLDPAAREDVCAQCHLQGEASYPRSGFEVGDYRPGQRLEETRVIFVTGTRTTADGTTRAVSHVEQMRASRCFQDGNGRFGCLSCHDPHSRPKEAEMASFYRAKCTACHNEQSCVLSESDRLARRADDSCIACHMPRLGANDVPHTAQTDHRVLRKPVSGDAPSGQPMLPEFYDHAEQRLPRLAVDYARGLWLAERAEKRNDSETANRAFRLLLTVESEVPDDARILDALGMVLAIQGRSEDSLKYWKKSLAIDPNRERALETVAHLLYNAGRLNEARPYFERALELNPWRSSLWRQYSQLLGQRKEWKGAIAAAKKAQELDPSAPQIYLFLAEACEQAGDVDLSRHYKALFERIRQVRK